MKKFITAGLMALLVTVGTGVAAEMTAPAPAMSPAKGVAMEQVQTSALSAVEPVARATHLLNMAVQSPDGSVSGTVKDIVLSPDRARIEFLGVLFAEAPQRVVHVPFAGIRATQDGSALVYNIVRDDLNTAAGTPLAAWPADLESRCVSHLIALPVRDNDGKSIATIRDLLINTSKGTVAEATLGMHGFLVFNPRLASVEWGSVTISPDARSATVALGAKELKGLAYKERDYWRNLGFAGGQTVKPRLEPTAPHASGQVPMDPDDYQYPDNR